MKKQIFLPLMLLVILFLCACGVNSESNTQTETTSEEIATEEETTLSEISLLKEGKINKGDIIQFGAYYQSGTYTKEPINWIVLAIEEGKALLISEKILGCAKCYCSRGDLLMRYGSVKDVVNSNYSVLDDVKLSWNDSTIKTQLFTSRVEMFSSEERKMILSTTLFDEKDPSSGEITETVFLLSEAEARQYFDSDEERIAYGTPYAKSKKLAALGDGPSYWWLRSPGDAPDTAYYVAMDGAIRYEDGPMDAPGGGIRPSMWVKIGQ